MAPKPTTVTKELPVIDYLSVIPGSGKTHWAANYILESIVNRSSILFFVAPTNDLLTQVLTEIKRINDNRPLVGKGTAKYSSYGEKGIPRVCILSREANIDADYSVTSEITSILQGDEPYRRAEKGDCYLITHTAFMLLNTVIRKKEIEVIFDEAGGFTVQSEPLKLPPNSMVIFRQYVKTTPCLDAKGKPTDFERLTLLNDIQLDQIAELGLKGAFRRLLIRLKSKRYEIYRINRSKDDYEFFDVLSPTRVFRGFKRAVVMSAFFESTEMFHLLSKRNKMNNISYEIDQNRIKDIVDSYTKVTIHPLMPTRKHKVTKAPLPLTKAILNDNLLVTEEQESRLEEFYLKWASTVVNRKGLVRHIKAPVRSLNREGLFSTELAKLRDYLKRGSSNAGAVLQFALPVDPLSLFVYISSNILSREEALNSESKPLLVINADVDRNGLARDRSISGKENFEIISSKSHGINKWEERTALVFLGAFNPPEHMKRFLRFYLPDYNHVDEWVGNAALQNLSRTCVRRPKNPYDVHIIVPDTYLAKYIATQMRGAPTVMKPIIKVGTLKLFGSYSTNPERNLARRVDPSGELSKVGRKPKFLPEDRAEANSLRTKIANATRQIESGDVREKVVNRLSAYKDRLVELQSKVEGGKP